MSTKIKGIQGAVVEMWPSLTPGYIALAVDEDVRRNLAVVPAACLIAAVEAECGVRLVPADAVVVLREELPPVVVESKASGEGGSADAISAAVGHMFVQRYASATPAILRSEARCLLALAEHIDQHPPVPPVDEVQVEALAGLLADEVHRGGPIPDARFFEYLDTARALIRKGVRMPEDAS